MNCCAVWPTESRRHDFRQGWAGAGHATHRGSLQGSCVMKKSFSTILLMAALVVASAASAQDLTRYSDEGLRKELSAIADSEKAVLVPMRDGIGLSTNIWRPKGATGKLPTVLWKTPYNEHKVRGGTARYAIEAGRRGYAFIVQNERGRYFSQGDSAILGSPQTDASVAHSLIPAHPGATRPVRP